MTDLEAKVAATEQLVDNFLKKSRLDLRVTLDDGAAATKITNLEAALEGLNSRGRNKTLTVNVKADGAIAEVTSLGNAVGRLKDKTITVTTNYVTSGTPPLIPAQPGASGGGGSGAVLSSEQQLIKAGVAAAWTPDIGAAMRQKEAMLQVAAATQQATAANQGLIKAGVASAWSPAIGATQRQAQAMAEVTAQTTRAAEAQSQLIKAGTASAWSPSIGAARRQAQALAEVTAQTTRASEAQAALVKAGTASAWSPAIGAANRQAQAMGQVTAQTIRAAEAQAALVKAGVASNWTPAIGQAMRRQQAMQGAMPPVVNPRAGGGPGAGQMAAFQQMASGAIITQTITRPLIEGFKATIEASGEFEKRMREVGGLTNVGMSQMAHYKSEILKLANDDALNSKGPNELAEAFYLAASKNKDGITALESLKAAAHGATAGLGEVKDIEGGISSVLNAFNLNASDASHLMDVFVNTVKQGGAFAKEFSTALPKVAATAAAAGLSVEEMSASIATMTLVGIPAGTAATSLNRLLTSIIKPSEQAKRAIKELGTTFGEVLDSIKTQGLQATLADLFKRAGGDATKLAPVLGPINSFRAALTTQGSQPERYAKIVKSYQNIDGLTDRAAENATAGFAVQVERLKSSLEAAAISIGDRLAPKLAPVIAFLRDTMPAGVKTTIEAWQRLGPTIKTAIAAFVGFLAIAGPLLLAMGTGRIVIAALGSAIMSIAGPIAGLATVSLPLAGIALAAFAVGVALARSKLLEFQDEILKTQSDANELAARTKWLSDQLAKLGKVTSGSKETKEGIAELSKKLAEAGGDTSKLTALLKEAAAQKVEIGKDMKLSPAGKAVAQNELQQFINALSAMVINLKVKVNPQTGEDEVPGQRAQVTGQVNAASAPPDGPDKAAGDKILADWQTRANNVQIKLPVRLGMQTDKGYLESLQKAQKQIAEAEKSMIADYKKNPDGFFMPPQWIVDGAKGKGGYGAAGVAKIDAETRALHIQREAVEKLTDAELKGELKRFDKLAKEGKLDASKPDFDADAQTRFTKADAEFKRRHEVRQKALDLANQTAASAQGRADDAAAAAQQETNERLLGIQSKRVAELEKLWSGFGNQVESILSGIHRAGDDDKNTRELAAQAALAKREFAGIPPELKRVVIGIAAIGDAMDRLTRTRDKLRGFFGTLFKDALANGGDTAGIAAMAGLYERRLNYTNRMNGMTAQANRAAGPVMNVVEGWREAYSQKDEQLKKASALNGRAYQGQPYVDAGDAASKTYAAQARTFLGQGQSNAAIARAMGAAAGDEWCVGFIQAVRASKNEAPLPGGVSVKGVRAAAQKAGTYYTGQPNSGDVMTRVVVNARGKEERHVAYVDKVMPGGSFTTIGGNEGNTVNSLSRVKDTNSYNWNSQGIGFIRSTGQQTTPAAPIAPAPQRTAPAQVAAPVGPTAPEYANVMPYNLDGTRVTKSQIAQPQPVAAKPTNNPNVGAAPDSGSAAAIRAAATPVVAPAKVARPWAPPVTPKYENNLLEFALPKGFGSAVTNNRMALGEVRDAQRMAQELILNRKQFAEMVEAERANDATRKADLERKGRGKEFKPTTEWGFAADLRKNAAAFDHSTAIAKVSEGAFGAVRDMGRQIRMVGKENNPYLVLMEEFDSGANRLLSKHGKAAMASMTLGLMVENTREATRQARAEMSRQVQGLRAVAPLLDNPENSGATYDRALHQEQARREIWAPDTDVSRELEASKAMEKEAAEIRKRADKIKLDAKAPTFANARTPAERTRALDNIEKQAQKEAIATEASNKAQRAAALAKEANRQATERLNNEMLKYDSQVAADTLRQVAQANRDKKAALNMQRYVNGLMADGFLKPADAQAAGEVEAARREMFDKLKPLVDSGQLSKKDAAYQVAQAGTDKMDAQAAEGQGAKATESGNATKTREITAQSLEAQRELIAGYRSGSRELDVQLQLEKKRADLLSANVGFSVDRTKSEDDINAEVAAYEREVRAQSELTRLQQERANILSAQQGVLDLQMAAEMVGVQSARERLAIEFKYQDLKNQDLPRDENGAPIVPEELKTAREAQLDQSGKNESVEDMRKVAAQTHSMLSDAVYTGLKDGSAKGVKSMIQNLRDSMFKKFADDWTGTLTNKLYRKRAGGKDTIDDAEPSYLDDLKKLGRRRAPRPALQSAPLGVPFAPGVIQARYERGPTRSNALTQLVGYASGQGGDAGAKGSPIKSAVIHIERAVEHIAKAEVHLPAGAGTGAGSGAGSAPSAEQFMGELGGIGSYASTAASIFGGLKTGGLFN